MSESATDRQSQALTHDDAAVLKHVEIYQNIIMRLANNSFSCKKLALMSVSIISGLAIKDQLYSLAWLTMIVTMIFYGIDSYNLMLERRFASGFRNSVDKIKLGIFEKNDLFVMRVDYSGASFWGACASFSTWPIYFGIYIISIFAVKLSS